MRSFAPAWSRCSNASIAPSATSASRRAAAAEALAEQAELVALRRQLHEAVEAEAYEEAARIRDLLRQKEAPG